MSTTRKTPKLRFPEFTDDWEQRKLKEITSRVQGNDGRVNLQTLTISAGNGWMKQEDRFSANIAGKEQKNYTLLKKGELAYNHGNSKLAKFGAVFELKDFDEALVPRVYHSFRVNNKTNSSFIEYMFATKLPDKELGKLVSSGARMDGLLNIGYEDFVGINITVPSLEEQQKIAYHFRKLDEVITLHQRELDSLKKLKKSLLQKMFPKNGEKIPELRFPEFTGDWEQRKLGEITGKVIGGGTPKTCVSEYWDGDIPWIQSSNVQENEMFDFDIPKSITQEGLEKSAAKLVPENSIAVVTHVGVGKLVFVPFSYTTSQDFTSLSELKTDAQFTCYSLYQRIKNDLHIVQGSAIKGITKDDLLSKEIMVPEIQEQRKIGNYFRKLDNLITLHQRELDTLKKLKKGLLQNMFV